MMKELVRKEWMKFFKKYSLSEELMMGEEEYEDDERSVCKEQMKKQICTFEVKYWWGMMKKKKEENNDDERILCKERMKKQISTLEVKNWLMTVIF